jgi:biotin-dependent carboxylase-like uncharacterized protein
MTALLVQAPGPLTTIQDLGRPGHAALGVGPSGAADRAGHLAAQAAVGNDPTAAGLEVTLGGLRIKARGRLVVALAGAPVPDMPLGRAIELGDGETLRLGVPTEGLRTYLAVRGGVAVEPVLGSRSTDTFSGLGPAVLTRGTELPVGRAESGATTPVDLPPLGPAPPVLHVDASPWSGTAAAFEALCASGFDVTTASNRVGVRLAGPALPAATGRVDPEPLVVGAVQLPPDGSPFVFLTDHPVTGGYPVIAVLRRDDVGRLAQLRPGQAVRFVA